MPDLRKYDVILDALQQLLEEKKIQKWRFLMMEEDLCMLEQCKIVFLML